MAQITETIELKIIGLTSSVVFHATQVSQHPDHLMVELKADMTAAEHKLCFAVVGLDADTAPTEGE
jgi:hypothetical protein